jgi:hypothetical protein
MWLDSKAGNRLDVFKRKVFVFWIERDLRFRGLFEQVIIGKRFPIIHTSIPYMSVIRHFRPEFIKTVSINFHCFGKVNQISNQIVRRMRKLRKRQNHLGIFVNWPPNHHGRCYPNLRKWDPNQIKNQSKKRDSNKRPDTLKLRFNRFLNFSK